MKYFFPSFLFLAIIFLGVWQISIPNTSPVKSDASIDKLAEMQYPFERFAEMRSWPDPTFEVKDFAEKMAAIKSNIRPERGGNGFDEDWTVQGPGNIGGRINTVAIHPNDPKIMYVGCAKGGIFKTTDGGTNWVPIFDDQSYLSISHITFDPADPNKLYVGTGDLNISGSVYVGDGVYRSDDAGQTWTHLGLTDQRIISRVFVDPADSKIIYAATMGTPFQRDNKRGLYKSTDSGQSWQQVLFVADQAGIIDFLIDPSNTQILYAASWDRIRTNRESLVTGPNGKIWKSIDGGANWTHLTNGLPNFDVSRIGITMSGQNSNTLYASYTGDNLQLENVYKTTDAGANWTVVMTDSLNSNALGGFGWYFGQIRVNPADDDEIYVLGVELHNTSDGGLDWQRTTPPWWQYIVHADMHDLQFVTKDHLVLATDGGLYESRDRGQSWTDIDNIPNTQFYRVAVNPHNPTTYYGGTQDNGSTGGNAATINSWERIWGGDGFQMRFDAIDPMVWYAETQNGNLRVSTDGGMFFNRHNDGIDPGDRRNWDMPFVLSENDPNLQFTGTYRVYKNTTGPNTNWQPISDVLSDSILAPPDHARFHTISTVNVSALDDGLIYTGLTDGNVWVTKNGGTQWDSIHTGLPVRYVTSIKPSPVNLATVFVSHTGYKDNDWFPHIHRSDNYGANWIDISGDLPQLAINDILIYPQDDNILFAATDGGVYGTTDGGNSWHRVGGNMPVVPVFDMEFNFTTRELIAGTFARSLQSYPLDSILNNIGPPASIESGFAHLPLTIYPNPATETIAFQFPSEVQGEVQIELYDLTGKVLEKRAISPTTSLNISHLPTGIYVLKAYQEGECFSGRFTKSE